MRSTKNRFFSIHIALALVIAGTICSGEAKRTTTYEGSIKYREGVAEEQDADRGVLGVRYAIAVDLMRKTHIIIVNVVKNGPSDAAGLRRGDRIIAIDDAPVSGLKTKEVGPLMRGDPGTVLKVTIKRGMQTFPLEIVRGNLTQLPDRDFQARVLQDALTRERDSKIKSLAESMKDTYPDISKAVEDGNYADAATALLYVSGSNAKPDTLLLYGLVLAKLRQTSEAVRVLKQVAPVIQDKKTEDLIRELIANLTPHAK